MLTDIQKSPYRDRIFVILDSTHMPSLPAQLTAMGIPADKILVWPKNGIEYYYPPSILDEIFGAGSEIEVTEDAVSRNGITYKKGDLVEKVAGRLEKQTSMHPDFERLLLLPLEEAIGLAANKP